jgi:hypothetical protein
MRNLRAVLFGIGLSLFVAGAVFVVASKAQQESADEDRKDQKMDRKPVIVELFTSEGCSSCPPADLLLQKLVAQQPVPGAEVIALEEHVDYWNHLGWADPYSSPDWTQRQQDYAAFFKGDPYTPQAVVDGHSQFVGNSARDASQLIETASTAEKAEVAIALAETGPKSSKIHISVGRLPHQPSGDVAEIWLAVTEDGLQSSVSRGENAGRTLPHIATLRSLRKIGVADANGSSVSFTADQVVKLDAHWNPAKLRVAVFVQKKKSREIIGAASSAIQPVVINTTRSS